MRMFFGVISPRSGSGTCERRQRLRSAMATAFLAASWPTMCLSSSWTISCGVIIERRRARAAGVLIGRGMAATLRASRPRGSGSCRCRCRPRSRASCFTMSAGARSVLLEERDRRGLRVGAAAAHGDDAALGLEHVAVAGDEERGLAVGHGEHRLEAAQHPVGAPVLRQLHRRAQQVALVLLELRLEALEEREGVGRGAGEAGEDAVVVEAADLARGGLDDDVAERHLPVAAHGDLAAAADADDGGAVEGLFGHGGASSPCGG